MRLLLSTIGSRGDVQPLVALAWQLRALGEEARLCVPPDFRDWIVDLGFPVTPIGPELRALTATRSPVLGTQPSPELRRQLAEGTVATQFATVGDAAVGCDVLVAGGALQIAARSVAERMQIRYYFAAYCPIVLPSPNHPPPPLPGRTPPGRGLDNHALWDEDTQRWNDLFGNVLNSHRAAWGLAPVSDVRGHIFGERPLLAADHTLGPWDDPSDTSVIQTGAWILADDRPLSTELEAFLEAGDEPIYFGFGSMRAPADLNRVMIDAARGLGCRAIVSRGWAELSVIDGDPDCLSVGETNLQALFKRVAAVVHHGGAGTTTAAAVAGVPQVVIPQNYDQPYWAQRVEHLGIGIAHPPGSPTTDSLTTALSQALDKGVAERARLVAEAMRTDGSQVAAQFLISGRSAL